MHDDDGYDAVSGHKRIARYTRWRSPYYWLALVACIGTGAALIATVGGAWFLIPVAAWPAAGYVIAWRLQAAD